MPFADGARFDQAGADPVGPFGGLAPFRAGGQPDRVEQRGIARAAARFEHHPVQIGQDHAAAGPPDRTEQIVEHRHRGGEQFAVGLAQGGEPRCLDPLAPAFGGGIEPVVQRRAAP